MTIKVIPSKRCLYEFPVLSVGGIQIGKDYCQLPIDHDGPHRHRDLGIAANKQELERKFDPVKRKYY